LNTQNVSTSLPKAVIFDLGGVIVEWDNSVTYRAIEEEYGVEIDAIKSGLEERLPLVQMGLLSEEEWLRDFFRSNGVEPSEGFEEIWGATFVDARNVDDVVALVEELKEKGLKLAALSNIEPSRATEMRGREVMRLFDVTVFSCDVGTRKASIVGYGGPTGENIFNLTLERLGLSPTECIHIDDNVECVEAAGEAGIEGILYLSPEQLREELNLRGLVDPCAV
jgi:FMN phosphatase YigB (HAD superfamily)